MSLKHLTVNDKDIANGVAGLDAGGKIPLASLPTGIGDVISVNTKTGIVVLNPDDLSDAITVNKFVTAGDITNLSNLSGINSGDTPANGVSGALQFSNGSGAFLSDNGNIHWDNTNKRLGLGTIAPVTRAQIVGTTIADSSLSAYMYSNDNSVGNLTTLKARGTEATPIAILDGDFILDNRSGGYDGSQFGLGVQIFSRASENWTGSARGSKFYIASSINGSTTTPVCFEIDEVNDIRIYNALRVGGDINLNTHKLLQVVDGTALTDGVNKGQLSTIFSFTGVGADSFTNTTYANLPTNRVRIATVTVSKTSKIDVTGLINRFQHSAINSPTFSRIRLTGTSPVVAAVYSQEFAVGGSDAWNFKQMKLEAIFTGVAAGTYEIEIEVKVLSGTGSIFNDGNGAGTRILKATVIPN